jgi:hypothetical protein
MKNKLFSQLMTACILTSSFFLLCSCYRMPGDNDYSVVPTTNNPSVTYEKNDNMMPSMKY